MTSRSDLDSVRSILLGRERAQLHALEAENETLRAEVQRLQSELAGLQSRVQSDAETLVPRLTPAMGGLVGQSIRDSRDEMAEALAPVMGEAIRVQIRDSRKDMIEALYPIIGETVQRAISEFARELQRNIDAQLRTTFGPEGMLRAALARLRGVSPAQLTMRDAMPFALREAFLIQHHSGLLMAHWSTGGQAESEADSDLVGGMLTAIRDFMHDSFGQQRGDDELDEIQFGDQRVIIQSTQVAYIAVVIMGIEPEGFRAGLRDFITDLHVRHEAVLRDFDGDTRTLPNLDSKLARLAADLSASGSPQRRPLSRNAKLLMAGGAVLAIAAIAVACFYLQFTLALLPIAFPGLWPAGTAAP